MTDNNRLNLSYAIHWIILTVSLASVSSLLISAGNLENIKVGDSFLPLVFWGWYLVFDGFILVLGLALFGIIVHYANCPGDVISITGGFVLGGIILGLVIHSSLLYDLLVVAGSTRLTLFSTAGLFLAVSAVACSLRDQTRHGLIVSVLLVGCLVIALYPEKEINVGSQADALKTTKPNVSENFIVLAVDGADWDYIDQLIDKGQLPNFESLKQSGVHGDLKTITPTSSPVIWTSIATGRTPEDHGVSDFVSLRILGSNELFSPLKSVPGFSLEPLFRQVIKEPIPVNNRNRSKPAFWNISSMFGNPLTLINWWVTWPAEPIEGMVVTDRIHYRGFGRVKGPPDETDLTHPEALYEEIRDLVMKPSQLTFDQASNYMDISREDFRGLKETDWKHHQLKGEFRFIYSIFETNRRITNRLIEIGEDRYQRAPDLMAMFRLIDLVGHTAMKYSTLVNNHLGASKESLRKYGDVLSHAYRQMDTVIGNIKKAHPAKNIIIVSDHGFQMETRKNGEQWYNHKNAPPGIFLASGPAFSQGKIENLHVYDVMPLLCHLTGLPVAKDFESSVPLKVFSESLRQRSVTTIPTYGSYEPGKFRRGAESTNQRIKDQLEALGYIE